MAGSLYSTLTDEVQVSPQFFWGIPRDINQNRDYSLKKKKKKSSHKKSS